MYKCNKRKTLSCNKNLLKCDYLLPAYKIFALSWAKVQFHKVVAYSKSIQLNILLWFVFVNLSLSLEIVKQFSPNYFTSVKKKKKKSFSFYCVYLFRLSVVWIDGSIIFFLPFSSRIQIKCFSFMDFKWKNEHKNYKLLIAFNVFVVLGKQ